MNKELKELQKLKGIGEVLAQRLFEASYNTIAKVAAAEEHGLKQIPGMNPQKVRSIVTQAREMTSEAEKSRPKIGSTEAADRCKLRLPHNLSYHKPQRRNTMIGTILIVILILFLIGALPTWPHSQSWGYAPSGILGRS